MLDVAHHHVGGFPAAGVHDCAEVDAGSGHVLGGAKRIEHFPVDRRIDWLQLYRLVPQRQWP